MEFQNLSKEQKKIIHGWCMYDWANSGFATTIVAIVPIYFIALFQDNFGDTVKFLGLNLSGSSMWSLAIALSAAIIMLTGPILGALADKTSTKKKMLIIYTAIGSISTMLMFFAPYFSNPWAWFLGCFVTANVGFIGGTAFYNALLPHVVAPQFLDKVSARGFAYGYIGGGLLLLIHLAIVVTYTDSDSLDLITRACIASVGLWWIGWSILTFKLVPELRENNNTVDKNMLSESFRKVLKTIKNISHYKMLGIYLIAYFFFTDGIATVLSVAGAFGADVLGVSLLSNMATILIVQFIAAPGALLFSKLADIISAKKALIIALIGWIALTIFALSFAPLVPQSFNEFDIQITEDKTGTFILQEFENISEVEQKKLESLVNKKLIANLELPKSDIAAMTREISNNNYKVSIAVSGSVNTRIVGELHPSNIDRYKLSWWTNLIRNNVWIPFGINIDIQWLILGSLLGVFMGGSQALARSIFAYMVPKKESAEFFGFFALIGRTATIIGPLSYAIFSSKWDSKIAILSLLILMIIGIFLLKFVNVEQGKRMAEK
jgi:MFS transporter, UMF1 family